MKNKLLLLLLMFGLLGSAFGKEMRLMRFPNFYKNKVVFSYAGDLYLMDRAGGEARRLTSDPGYEMFAKFSPDGTKIAFTAQYDGNTEVYVMPAEGGQPKRLTYTATLHRDDVSDRMGPNNMVMAWTPDGKYIIYRSRRFSFNSFVGQLFKVSVDGGMSTELPLATGGFCSFNKDGSMLAFNRVMREFRTWKYYKGGMADDVWTYNFKSHKVTKITDNISQDIFPMWHNDDIYFASDRDRIMNLFVYNTTTKKTEKVTNFKEYDVKFPSIGTDGIIFENEGFLYIYRFHDKQLEKLNVQINNDFVNSRNEYVDESKYIEDVAISPQGNRLVISARGDIWTVPANEGISYNITKSSNAHDRSPHYSPDGKYLAWISDMSGEDQIYVKDNSTDAEPIAITNDNTYLFDFSWSPDSKKIAYHNQNFELNIVDVTSKKVIKVLHSDNSVVWDYNWSPDSKWLTYADPRANDMSVVEIYNLEKKKSYEITKSWYDAGEPIFSSDGKYLFFTSKRDFNPTYNDVEWNFAYKNMSRIYMVILAKDTKSPFSPKNDVVKVENGEKKDKTVKDKTNEDIVVDLDGISDRVEGLPISSGYYWGLNYANGKLYYQTWHSGGKSSELKFFCFKKKKENTVGKNLSITVSSGGKKAILSSHGNYYVVDVPAGKPSLKKCVDLSNMKCWVNKSLEWKQIYDESWRQMREFFYDKNMHGNNWQAKHDKYAKLIPWVNHRNDLTYLIGELIGELSIGHAYVNGGERPHINKIKTGLLGADIVSDKSGYFKVNKILKGENWRHDAYSPLTLPGVNVNVNDYIIAVDGVSTKNVTDFYSLLNGKANKTVELTVNNKASEQGSRTVLVKTIDDESELYYYNWVQTNIDKVNKATNGQVGYIHIPDMGPKGLNEFVKHFYPQLTKKALIIDDRGNGGGNVSPMIMERLRRELVFYTVSRNRNTLEPSPTKIMVGPKVLLINNYSASDGDLFPYRFRAHKEGKIIGVRSWGGVVGITGSLPFIDGGELRKPQFAPIAADGSKFVIEGHGIDPDIVIDNDPYKEYMGEDAQLQKAIDVIVKELKEHPVNTPTVPTYPDKSK